MYLKQRSPKLQALAPAEAQELIQTYTTGHASAVSGGRWKEAAPALLCKRESI